jgi:hypothetical protein
MTLAFQLCNRLLKHLFSNVIKHLNGVILCISILTFWIAFDIVRLISTDNEILMLVLCTNQQWGKSLSLTCCYEHLSKLPTSIRTVVITGLHMHYDTSFSIVDINKLKIVSGDFSSVPYYSIKHLIYVTNIPPFRMRSYKLDLKNCLSVISHIIPVLVFRYR